MAYLRLGFWNSRRQVRPGLRWHHQLSALHPTSGLVTTNPGVAEGAETAVATLTIETTMRPRVIAEVLVIVGIIGLLLEVAEGHTWIVVGAGVAAAIWLLGKSH